MSAAATSISEPMFQALKQWPVVFRNCSAHFPQFDQCWYEERTLAGQLAQAVWKKNGIAIIEPQTPKFEQPTQYRWNGKPDLLVEFPSDQIRIGVETKLCWVEKNSKPNSIKAALESSIEESGWIVENVFGKPLTHRIGITFVLIWGDSVNHESRFIDWKENCEEIEKELGAQLFACELEARSVGTSPYCNGAFLLAAGNKKEKSK